MTTNPSHPAPTARRMQSLRFAILLALPAVAIGMGIAAMLFMRSTTRGERFSDSSDYPAARQAMLTIYGQDARHLPEHIPSEATNISVDGSTNGFLQASPRLRVSFVLTPEAADDELRRLRAMVDGRPPESSTESEQAPPAGRSNPDAPIQFDFSTDLGRIARASVDPTTGEIIYSITSN